MPLKFEPIGYSDHCQKRKKIEHTTEPESEYRRQEGIGGGEGNNERCGGSFRLAVPRI